MLLYPASCITLLTSKSNFAASFPCAERPYHGEAILWLTSLPLSRSLSHSLSGSDGAPFGSPLSLSLASLALTLWPLPGVDDLIASHDPLLASRIYPTKVLPCPLARARKERQEESPGGGGGEGGKTSQPARPGTARRRTGWSVSVCVCVYRGRSMETRKLPDVTFHPIHPFIHPYVLVVQAKRKSGAIYNWSKAACTASLYGCLYFFLNDGPNFFFLRRILLFSFPCNPTPALPVRRSASPPPGEQPGRASSLQVRSRVARCLKLKNAKLCF